MDIFEEYSKKMNMSNRSNTDAVIENSREDIEIKFDTSPSFYQVDIDGELTDTIINKTNDFNIKQIHFRYEYTPRIGSIISYDNKKHLLLETDRDELYSFGKMEECNSSIDIQTEEVEKILIGYDQDGRPQYEEKVVLIPEPCVVRDTYYSASENAQIPMPEGKLEIFAQHKPMLNIKVNEELKMYGKTFKIADISYVNVVNDVGYIKIHAERRDSEK